MKSMLRVGSSTSIRGRATGLLGVGDRVADVDRAERRRSATMSPASACSTSIRPSLSKTSTLSIEPVT